MKNLCLYLATGLIACVLTGCATSSSEAGTKISADKVSQIQKGVTTRAQIEALLGPADFVSMMPGGKRMLNYNYVNTDVQAHATAASYIPYVGLFAGGTKGNMTLRQQRLQIMLDEKGVVEDYDFSDNTTNSEMAGSGLMGIQNTTAKSSTAPTTVATDSQK